MISPGDALGERFPQLRATCRSCGRGFSFEDGVRCARQTDIGDQVVVCPYCYVCYQVTVTPFALTLLEDVTHTDPQLAARCSQAVRSDVARPPATSPADAAPAGTAGLCPKCGATAAPANQCCTACGAYLDRAPDGAPLASAVLPAGAAPAPAVTLTRVAPLQPARPGCVTAYALLLFLATGLLTIGGIALGGSGDISGPQVLLFVALGGGELAIAIGLWRMQNWARVLLIVVQGLGIAVSLVSLLGGSGTSGVLLGVAVNAFITSWFARNGRLFC